MNRLTLAINALLASSNDTCTYQLTTIKIRAMLDRLANRNLLRIGLRQLILMILMALINATIRTLLTIRRM